MTRATLLAAALSVASAVSADDAFRDDFERGAGAALWRLPSRQWRVKDGAGMDGSQGLVLEYAKGEKPVWIERNERFRVEPGEAYRFEAWIDDSSFHAVDRPVSVSFSVYDAKGRLMRGAGAGAMRVMDNIVRKDGWYRVEGVTRPLPADAATARFYIWAREGSHGRVAFDGFRAWPVAANPLEPLFCSAYRDEAAAGAVSFFAGCAVNALKHPPERLRAELRYAAADGGGGTAAARIADGFASATLPVAAFAPGTNEVRLVLRDGGEILGETSCRFARIAEPPPRRVRIDGAKRTVVDGKTFFPLGMYWQDVNAADLALYTNGTPFNCLMPYKRPDAAGMDLCAAAGVKVIFPICGFYEVIAGTNAQKAAECDGKWIRGQVEAFRSHPALLAWYLADEIPTTYAGLLEARNEMCRALDPDHPTWVVLNGLERVRPFVRGYDVVGMDPYPIGSPFRKDAPISLAAEWAVGAVKEMAGARAMWQVPQSFDWTWYAAGQKDWRDRPGYGSTRMPTREEIHSMTWQAVAGGANGLVFYSFFDIAKRGRPKETVDAQWADIVAVANEVKAREAVLLSEPGPVTEGAPDGIVCRTWRTADGGVTLLAVNALREPVECRIRIGDKTREISLPPLGVEFTAE